MAEGNRKDPRARVLNMTVRYKSATVDEFIENHSHDISRGGIFIKTRSPFPAGTLLKFEVRIAEDQRLMHGVGRVVWRREPERAEESFPAGMGIKFIKTGEGATELINQLVAARNGAESSFDAGVRESGTRPSGAPPAAPSAAPSAVPGAISGLPMGIASGAPIEVPVIEAPTSESSPALFVESGPRSVPTEGEIQVSSPPKKRRDQAPEKRKVVLQGPALDAPPSSTRRVEPRAAAEPERAPSRDLSAAPRNTTFDETTSPRARATKNPNKSSPSVVGLFLILGVIGVGVFIAKNRDQGPEAPAALAPEPPPAPPPPVVAAEPEPVTPEVEKPEVVAEEAAAPAVPGSAATPAATVPGSAATPAAAVGTPAAPAAATAPSAGAKPAPAPAAVTPPPAPAKPVAAPPKAPLPVVPKPRAVAPVAKPPAAPAPSRQTPSAPPSTAPSGTTAADAEKKPSDTTTAPPPAQKKPAPTTAEAPKPAPKPAAPPPAAPPPAPPATDDNPY